LQPLELFMSRTHLSRAFILAAAAIAGLLATAAVAQHASHPHAPAQHAASVPADGREVVNFPPEMQANFLGNMRDHMQTIDGILQAMARGDYSGASRIASERLGLDSPSAEGCKPKAKDQAKASVPAAPASPAIMSKDVMMALYMPEAMRGVGEAMHIAASEFAEVARRAEVTRDAAAAMIALSQVTQNCVACHSTYRLR
jgi:hypothetical protein